MNDPADSPIAGLPDTGRRPRLNPFSFPSNTDFFFALLVFAILAVSLEFYDLLYLWNPSTALEYAQVAAACTQHYDVSGLNLDSTEFSAASQGSTACMSGIERKRSLWMLTGLLPELALAGLIYLIYPAWLIRRRKLVPLTREDFPALVDLTAHLSSEIGLKHPPALFWSPMDLSVGGMAFGRLGRYSVKLSGGLVSQFFSDPQTFQAVMLHELSHLRSQDIDKTYLTISLGMAFLISTLIPFAYFLFQSSPDLIFDLTWRIVFLTLLVYLIRNVVLRSREYYADLRAYQHLPIRDHLKRMLASLHGTTRSLPGHLFEVHPQSGKRISMLDDPLPLFEQGFLTALATGLVVGIGYEPLMGFLSATNLFDITSLAFLTGFFVAPIVACIIGLGVWRSVFARSFDPRVRLNTGQIAFGLALGAILGRLASPVNLFVINPSSINLAGDFINLLIDIIWTSIVTISLVYYFRWVASGAALWLRVALRRPSPKPYSLAGVVASGLLLSIWFGAAFLILYLCQDLGTITAPIVLSVLSLNFLALPSPVTTLLLVTLWAFPLAAAVFARKIDLSRNGGWAFLDPGLTQTLGILPRFQFRTALLPAALAGIAYFLLVILIRLGMRLVLSEATRNLDSVKVALLISCILLAAIFQAAAAVWVVIRAPRYRIFLGLLAAFAGGCIMADGFLTMNLLFGGTMDGSFAWMIFSNFVNSGGIAAIPFALFANWLVKQRLAGVRQGSSPIAAAGAEGITAR